MPHAARLALILVAGLVWGGAGRAADKLDEAHAHFRAGEASYRAGRYEEAVREFTAGYELAPRPLFLLNLGQAQRKLKNPAKALDLFEKYLNATAANDARRAEVQQMVSELRAGIAAAPPAPEAAPEAAPAPRVESPLSPAAPPEVVVARPVLERSFARRHWWIFPVAAVVAGTAIGLGLYYGLPSANRFDCSHTIACVDATH